MVAQKGKRKIITKKLLFDLGFQIKRLFWVEDESLELSEDDFTEIRIFLEELKIPSTLISKFEKAFKEKVNWERQGGGSYVLNKLFYLRDLLTEFIRNRFSKQGERYFQFGYQLSEVRLPLYFIKENIKLAKIEKPYIKEVLSRVAKIANELGFPIEPIKNLSNILQKATTSEEFNKLSLNLAEYIQSVKKHLSEKK